MEDGIMNDQERSSCIAAYALAQVGGPYIYGATAKTCTISYRMQRAEQYPQYANKIEGACPALSGEGVGCVGCKHNGRLAHDCAQLTRFAAKAAELSLPSGATSQWNKGDWAASGEISTLPACTICFVYRKASGKMQHTGIYMGDGTVIDARGHDKGVLHATLASYPWTHWAILQGMELPDNLLAEEELERPEDRPMLRCGSSGDMVRQLQTMLRKCGYTLTVDGKFGAMTQQAVMSFQGTHGLKRDAIVGPLTWAELDAAVGSVLQQWTVTISGLTEAMARVIVAEHGGRMEVGG